MKKIFLSLGSNLGDRLDNLRRCVNIIKAHSDLILIDSSSIYETEPMYNINQPNFLNMVILIESNFFPIKLLDNIKKIEIEMGRSLKKSHNNPRIIDIDILTYGDKIISSNKLEIPHPRAVERVFVLKPWTDIQPNYKLPGIEKTISSLLSLLEANQQCIKLFEKNI